MANVLVPTMPRPSTAQQAATKIATETKEFVSHIGDNVNTFIKKFVAYGKHSVDYARNMLAYNKTQADSVNKIANPKKSKWDNMREKLLKYQDKWLRTKNFFKVVGGYLKNIASRAGHWIFQLLKLLFFLAIFDPKGTFLVSILNFIIKMVVWVIKILAKNLPRLINSMIYIITKVLPGALKSAIAAILPALSEMWFTFSRTLGKKFPMLKPFFDAMGNLFKKDGPLYKFLMMLADNLPLILLAVAAFSIFFKILPIVIKFGKALMWLGYILKGLFMGIKAMATFLIAHPIVAIIVGIALALILIWKYSDKIVAFFESIGKWFSELSTKGKILVGALALLMFPITMIIGLIYGLAKLFSYIKKRGWKILDDIKKGVDDFIQWWVDLGDAINKQVKKHATPKNAVSVALPIIGVHRLVWKAMVWFWEDKVKWVKEKVSGFINFFKKLFNKVKKLFSDIKRYLMDFFRGDITAADLSKKLKDAVSSAFSGVLNFFSGLGIRIKKIFSGIWKSVRGIMGFLMSFLAELIENPSDYLRTGERAEFFERVRIRQAVSAAEGQSSKLIEAARRAGISETSRTMQVLKGEKKGLMRLDDNSIKKLADAMTASESRKLLTSVQELNTFEPSKSGSKKKSGGK